MSKAKGLSNAELVTILAERNAKSEGGESLSPAEQRGRDEVPGSGSASGGSS